MFIYLYPFIPPTSPHLTSALRQTPKSFEPFHQHSLHMMSESILEVEGSEGSVLENIRPSEVASALGLPSNARNNVERDSLSYSSDMAHLVYRAQRSGSQSTKAAASSVEGIMRPLHVFLTGTTVPALRGLCSHFLSTTHCIGVPTIALSYEWIALSDQERNEMIEGDNRLSLEEVLLSPCDSQTNCSQ